MKKIFRTSKYVGRKFGNWVVTDIYLRKNYAHCTKHNAYTYQLERITSDNVCDKVITVSGATMTKIGRGLITPEDIALKMKEEQDRLLLYRFKHMI